MHRFRRLEDIEPKGQRVLVRADLNMPMADGHLGDRTRLARAAPTLVELAGAGARVVVLSHFGRPQGQRRAELSLAPVAMVLSEALGGRPVRFCPDCVGPEAEACVAALGEGEVALMENVRFHAGEEANDPDFADELARLGDIYVNDAFSCAHRAHASIEALARRLPAVAGRGMEAELDALTRALAQPKRPLAALVGGAKISTKLDVLGHLIAQVDVLIVVGAMANTFLHAQGRDVGRSLSEPDLADTARRIMARGVESGTELLLPLDARVARELAPGAASEICAIDAVPSDAMILDVGPATVAALAAKLEDCRTLLWNGPLGAFEVPPFDQGTNALARRVAELTRAGELVSVAGGGDTVAALVQAGVIDDFSYVSTAGGAFLEWLEGRDLPGVAALSAG